jgi:hypothetical protein
MVEPFGEGSTNRVPGAMVSRSVGDSDGSPSSRRPAKTARWVVAKSAAPASFHR